MTLSHEFRSPLSPGRVEFSTSNVTEIPRPAFTPVPRSGLIAELDAFTDSPDGSMLLICCPVGNGKTVLLGQWARRRRTRARYRRIAWLNANEHAAPRDVWQRLAAQLGLDASPRTALSTALADADALAEALSRLGERALVIIDDAHAITDPLTLTGLEQLLLLAPPNLTIVICGRYEPPIRWHLLEMGSRLRRWDSSKLAFSAAETARLCRDQGCDLGERELAMLTDLTRGWAALVRIAAISLAARPEDPAAVLTSFARLPVSVSDLLAGELIDTLSPGVRLFLTHTCVPAEFTERLAQDLIGGDAGHWLHELERMNYPLTTVVRDGEVWFTYHPLLRAYFLAELNRLGDQRGAELRLRTALFLEGIGDPRAALPHLLALPRREPLRNFLAEHALSLTLAGHGAAIFEAVAAAEPGLSEDPYPRLLRVVDALVKSDVPTARAHFDALPEHGPASFLSSDAITALTVAVRCELATATGPAPGDPGVPPDLPSTGHAVLDCYTAIETATAALVHGDPAAGEERLRQGLALAEVSALPQLRLRALVRLGMAAGLAGALTTMRRRADYALELATRERLLDTPEAAHACALAAFGAYLQGETPDLDRLAALRGEHILLDGSVGAHAGWHTHLVATLTEFDTAHDRNAAAELLRTDYARLLETHPVPATTAAVVPFVVWSLLSVRESYEAQLLLERARARLGDAPEIALARAALEANAHRSRAALELLEPLLDEATALPRVHRVSAWLQYAAAHDELNTPTKARDGLENALRHAAPEHLVRPFLDVPAALDLLDRFVGGFGQYDAFVILVRRHPLAHKHARHPNLTSTEMKVLRQLPSGRASRQIADDLGISINTVKTHLRGIYTKLGTGSRTEALDQARRSGLL
ncbi:LuxR C-terminal-related transcriptional regulator [Nocardia sp. NPDC055321]